MTHKTGFFDRVEEKWLETPFDQVQRREEQRLEPARSAKEYALWSENDLLKAIAREANRAAFTEFYNRHGHAVYNLCRFLCPDHKQAEQIVQETFLSIWTEAETYCGTHIRRLILRAAAKRCLRS